VDLANVLDLTLYGNSIYYDYATRCSNEEICLFFSDDVVLFINEKYYVQSGRSIFLGFTHLASATHN